MNKYILLSVGLMLIVFLSGCITGDTIKETGPTCNKPYILVGNGCCLDQNNNRICDKDETDQTEHTPAECVETTRVCVTPESYQICSNGRWATIIHCGDGKTCNSGSCNVSKSTNIKIDENNAKVGIDLLNYEPKCTSCSYEDGEYHFFVSEENYVVFDKDSTLISTLGPSSVKNLDDAVKSYEELMNINFNHGFVRTIIKDITKYCGTGNAGCSTKGKYTFWAYNPETKYDWKGLDHELIHAFLYDSELPNWFDEALSRRVMDMNLYYYEHKSIPNQWVGDGTYLMDPRDYNNWQSYCYSSVHSSNAEYLCKGSFLLERMEYYFDLKKDDRSIVNFWYAFIKNSESLKNLGYKDEELFKFLEENYKGMGQNLKDWGYA